MVSTRTQSQREAMNVELADRTAKRHRDGEAQPAASSHKKARRHKPDLVESSSHEPPDVAESFDDMLQPGTENSHPTKGRSGLHSEDADSVKPDEIAKTHVRFGSEEPPPAQDSGTVTAHPTRVTAVPASNNTKDAADGSDDEAPEAISTAKGGEHARTVQQDAAKAVQSQLLAAKEARRKNDRRLKSQASTSQKANRKRDERAAKKVPSQASDKLAKELLSAGELPEFLPDEILSADPTPSQLPTPLTTAMPNKKKLLADLPKPYKDVQAGDRVIRVLSQSSSSLPPRVSKVSKNLRETWLGGSKGGMRRGIGHRKPVNSGFIKR